MKKKILTLSIALLLVASLIACVNLIDTKHENSFEATEDSEVIPSKHPITIDNSIGEVYRPEKPRSCGKK